MEWNFLYLHVSLKDDNHAFAFAFNKLWTCADHSIALSSPSGGSLRGCLSFSLRPTRTEMVRSHLSRSCYNPTPSHDDHFLLQYTLEITGWVILWRYKMAISDWDSFFTIVVIHDVACANMNQRLLARYAISHIDTLSTFMMKRHWAPKIYPWARKAILRQA